MPWTTEDPPAPARNRGRADKIRCVRAANAVLRDGGWESLDEDARKELEAKAIAACLGAMDEQASDAFYVTIEKALDDVLVFPIGRFVRGKQERDFTRDDAEEMVRNFEDNLLERDVPVNREHDRPGGRVGKVLRLWVAEDGVRGELEDDGASRRFGYVSPEVRWEWQHPHTGAKHRNVLMGLALTNYPFFLGKMALWEGGGWQTYTDEDVVMLGDIAPMVPVEKTAQVIGELLRLFESEREQYLPSGRPLHLSADERRPFVHQVPVVRLDDAQRVAYGVVLQPDVPDAQGHVMSAAEIEVACHRYVERAQALDVHHDREASDDEVKWVECWIQREPVTWRYGERETEVLPGSWCMGVKFYSDELWQQVLDGAITGFSPKGWGYLSSVAAN